MLNDQIFVTSIRMVVVLELILFNGIESLRERKRHLPEVLT